MIKEELIAQWIKEAALWLQDAGFAAEPIYRPDLIGSYTLYCGVAEVDGQTYLLKRYNPGYLAAALVEVDNYRRYGGHPVIPHLKVVLPKNESSPKGILIPYLERKPATPISVLETLAINLILATIFHDFGSGEGARIYFDLKLDSLRLNADGGLHLIDFTDLLPPEDLPSRRSGLPVLDSEDMIVPPEGRFYQKVYEDFTQTNEGWSDVVAAASNLLPDSYHAYSLGGLTLYLLGASDLNEARSRIISGADAGQGGLVNDEQQLLISLLESMLEASNRPSLEKIRRVMWKLLCPHLSPGGDGLSISALRARRLFGTLPRVENDSFVCEIHAALADSGRII